MLHCAGGSAGWPKARKVLERVNCVVTERKRAEFATADIEQVRLTTCCKITRNCAILHL